MHGNQSVALPRGPQGSGGVVAKPIRGIAVGVVIALIAALLSFIGVAAPAHASSQPVPSGIFAENTFYAYAQPGEALRVEISHSGAPNFSVDVLSPAGTRLGGNGTYAVTQSGVYTIATNAGGSLTNRSTWTIAVQANGAERTGRVWTEKYVMAQSVNETLAAFPLWMVNNTGYIYSVVLRGFNGIASGIVADSVGPALSAEECATPRYKSVGAADTVRGCGETYRLFFENPADDLPASALSAAGVVPVKPAPLQPADLVIDDLSYVPVSPTMSVAGTLTWTPPQRFSGGYTLQIDADGNGSFDDEVDLSVPMGSDGTGALASYEFDGRDSAGELIDTCVAINARIHFDRLGEVHLTQNDVEGRSGLSMTRLNGPGAPDSTIYWDDTSLTGTTVNSTPVLDGTAGVDSSAGVHGWPYSVDSWGDNRNIDDWTYLPIDTTAASIELSGRCLSVTKSSDATADTRVGDTVTYTVTAKNDGDTDYTAENPAVVVDDLAGVLDDADYNGDAVAAASGALSYTEPRLTWTGPLAAGETVEITYSVTLTAGGDGTVRNVAFAADCNPGSPDCTVVTPSCTADVANCDGELFELPRLTIAKTADRAELPAVGETVQYTITVTNRGPGAYTPDTPASFEDDLSDVLDAATFNDDVQASTGDVSLVDAKLSWSGPLAAGASATVTYSVDYTAAGDRNLRNTVCVPASEVLPGAEACDSVEIPGAGLTQWKQVAASDSPAVAGSVLTYTLFFKNDGAAAATVDAVDVLTHVLDDADVTAEPASADALTVTRDGERIAVAGSVPAGETYSVSYQVTLRADGDRGDDIAANFLLQNDPANPPAPPAEPLCQPAEAEAPNCTTTRIAAVTYSKAVVASSDPIAEGTVLTYTVTVRNTGTAAGPVAREDVLTGVLDDADLTGAPASDTASVTVTGVSNGRFGIGGEIAAGETAVVTYQVTLKPQAERGDNRADNFLVTPGGTPAVECIEGSAECTTTPLPLIEASKAVDPEAGATVVADQQVTYTLTFTNSGGASGAVDYTDHLADVLDDATLDGAPVTSDPALSATVASDDTMAVAGALAAGQTVTVSYTVTVLPDGERGDNRLGNVLAPTSNEDPVCGEEGISCTENPIPELDDWKTVDPVSGSSVQPGQVLTYTLHFENTGHAPVMVERDDVLTQVLDDATVAAAPAVSDEALSVSPIVDGRFGVTGSLEPGQYVTVTYSVSVNPDGARGDDRLGNFLVPAGEAPPAECVPADQERPDCTVNHVSSVVASKSADPISGTEVGEGRAVTYTLTFRNVSQNPNAAPAPLDYTDHMAGVLDDATLTSAPRASRDGVEAARADDTIRVTGTLATGQTATVSYTVTVKSWAAQGDHRLGNVLAVTGEEPICAPDSVLCTSHDLVKNPPLAVTGSDVAWATVWTALVLLIGGAGVLLIARRRSEVADATVGAGELIE